MEKFLIDNNVISNYFSGRFSPEIMHFMDSTIDAIPNISVVTEIEALSWVNHDKSKESLIRSFISDANILGLTRAVVDQCIQLRRSRKIRTPDAIIAATAIAYGLTLVTSDNDFKGIPNLNVFDPFEIEK